MTCISQAWCPQCEHIVADMTCMCACSCDRHGPVCTPVIPDGLHDIRYRGRSTFHTEQEYLNGWRVGSFILSYETGLSVWRKTEPGHPTKTPYEVEADQRAQQAVRDAETWRVRAIEQHDQLNCNGGGSI